MKDLLHQSMIIERKVEFMPVPKGILRKAFSEKFES